MNDRKADTFAAVDVEALEREAIAAIEAASSLDGLDEVRVRYLGRKSELKLALREIRDRETGMTLNALRGRLFGSLKPVERGASPLHGLAI